MSDHLLSAQHADKLKVFLFSYQFAGQKFEIKISAKTIEEAEAKLFCMQNAQYDGELVGTINVPISENRFGIFHRLFKSFFS